MNSFQSQLGAQTVLMDLDSLKSFVGAARDEYEACTPAEPPGCFAVLVGRIDGDVAVVAGMEFAANVRAVDQVALEEFSTSVAPCFGAAYRNPRRGFWCSPQDLLRIHRQAARADLDILGAIHLHPDWHRIGPPEERGLRISERPTPMDEYMFRNTGYPVNVICYLESIAEEVSATLAAWGPPPRDVPDGHCSELTVRFRAK
ncbi:hypothetical protein ACFYO2_33575 [Streptomyces sp. NPDC006602]|uniref:hypothetical protein n=1 Tax=Streptomyces sp. NPDC006602 TaxID=3364751 RepID=UPI0036A096AF